MEFLYLSIFSLSIRFLLYVFFISSKLDKKDVTPLTWICTVVCAQPTISLTNCSDFVWLSLSIKENPINVTTKIIPISKINNRFFVKNCIHTPTYSTVGREDTLGRVRKC